jgi:hypothetical protein
MSMTTRKVATRQDIEKTLRRIADEQSAYYRVWATEWASLIANRAQGSHAQRKDTRVVDDKVSRTA